MIELKFMEALAAVIDQGGFEKASKVLHITQSAISQRVKQLEEMTGQILLIRSTPPVPTAAGTRIIKHFRQIKQLEDELIESLSPTREKKFTSLAIGINADSLAFWFLDAVIPFLRQEYVTLDIRVDDQDQTHRMLRDGEVFGCISALDVSVQGCGTRFLGYMTYRLVATPKFVSRWFPNIDLSDPIRTLEYVKKAPMLIFNQKDELQHRVLRNALKTTIPDDIPIHCIPSSEQFLTFIAEGMAYGVLPDIQSRPLLEAGKLVELFPMHSERVPLYWHCWTIKSRFLERFSNSFIDNASTLLESS